MADKDGRQEEVAANNDNVDADPRAAEKVASTTDDRQDEVDGALVTVVAVADKDAVAALADGRFVLIGWKGAPAETAQRGCTPGVFTSFADTDWALRGALRVC